MLTSCLALAACFGGGGNGITTGSTTDVYRIATNANATVNTNNSNITGMTSSVLLNDSDEHRAEAIATVAEALGDDVYTNSNLVRRAGSRARAGSTPGGSSSLTDAQKFYIAYHKLEKMESTLNALDAVADDADDFAEYVTDNKAAVIEAFKLLDHNTTINSQSSNDDIATAFGTVRSGLATAIAAVKPFSTVKIDQVQFNFAGDGKYAQFKIDSRGDIVSVAQFDRDTHEISDDGWFNRDRSNGKLLTTFSKQLDTWTFNLGDQMVGDSFTGDALTTQTWFNGISGGKGDLGSLKIMTEHDAAAPTRDQMKAVIDTEIAKFVGGQNGLNSGQRTMYTTQLQNYYHGLVDHYDNDNDVYDYYTAWTTTEYDSTNPADRYHTKEVKDYSVTLNTLGKGVGLKYSDFGYATMNESGEPPIYAPYAGGYEDLAVNGITTVASDVTFKGKAIVGVETDEDSMLMEDNNASLVLSNPSTGVVKSTLTMSNLRDVNTQHANRDWYTTTITQTGFGADTDTISVTKTINMKFDVDGKTIDENFAFHSSAPTSEDGVTFTNGPSSNWYAAEGRYQKAGTGYSYGGHSEFNYYSPDATQANMDEAGGTFHFGEIQSSDNGTEVSMYGAFGGKKQ